MNVETAKKNLRTLVSEFARTVQPIYEMLEWKWDPPDNTRGRFIPTIKDIEAGLNELIDSMNELPYNAGTGGLYVTAQPAGMFDLCDNLSLQFHLEHVHISKGDRFSIHKDAVYG